MQEIFVVFLILNRGKSWHGLLLKSYLLFASASLSLSSESPDFKFSRCEQIKLRRGLDTTHAGKTNKFQLLIGAGRSPLRNKKQKKIKRALRRGAFVIDGGMNLLSGVVVPHPKKEIRTTRRVDSCHVVRGGSAYRLMQQRLLVLTAGVSVTKYRSRATIETPNFFSARDLFLFCSPK